MAPFVNFPSELLQEEWDAKRPALLAQGSSPIQLHWPRAWATLTASYHPMNTIEVEVEGA
jgi:hypothetical protein